MKTAHCPFLALQPLANFSPSAYSPAHHAEGFAEGENVHHVVTTDATVGSVPFLHRKDVVLMVQKRISSELDPTSSYVKCS